MFLCGSGLAGRLAQINLGGGGGEELWGRILDLFRTLLFKAGIRNEWVSHQAGWILLAVGGILMMAAGLIIWRLTRKTPAPLRSLAKPATPGEAARAAKQALKMGNFVRAGELFEEAGKFDRAIEAYGQSNAFTRIAQVYLKRLGDVEQALKVLEEHSLWEQAAELLASQGRYQEAARRYQKAGREERAAENLEQAGEYEAAARLYERRDRPLDAGRCYFQAQKWLPAGEMFERVYRRLSSAKEEEKSRGRETISREEVAKKAAYCFKQGGEVIRAAELLVEAGLRRYGAELYVQASEFLKAAELYYQEKDFSRAAELYHKAGEKKRAAEVMAEFYQAEGKFREAARFLVMAGDYLAAADLYAGEEDFEKAAELYLRGGDSRTAGEMFVQAGRLDRAVGVYEKMGDLETAVRLCEESGNLQALAGLYERTGRLYEAGVRLQESGQVERAISVFSRITGDHSYYADVQYRLGLLYAQKGDYQPALERLQAMAGRMPLSPATLEFYYLLAYVYEQVQQDYYAYLLYQNICRYNYYFKDIQMRMQNLYQKLSARGDAGAATLVSGGGAGLKVHDRYQLEKELGRGGMGVVYLAHDTHLDRKVAFKVLSEQFKTSEAMIKNFESEAKSLAKLNHPYVVTLYDWGQEGGLYYIIMEYVEGKDFRKLLEGGKVLPVPLALTVFLQLAQALEAANKINIIHRDIKPANIMWTSHNIIKVMDFGLAKVVDQMREKRTVIAGSPYYMSPEQTLGRNVDHRSDIYSMGITMYELLAGRVPFKDGDIGYHHLHTPPPPPSTFNKKIPPELERIILKCMAKDQSQRYQSAGEVVAEVAALIQGGKGRT